MNPGIDELNLNDINTTDHLRFLDISLTYGVDKKKIKHFKISYKFDLVINICHIYISIYSIENLFWLLV